MELCDQYLHELIIINPIMNDYFKYPQYNNLSHILPNYWSKEYTKSKINLDKKYLKLLNNKKEKSLFDRVLQREIEYNLAFDKFMIYDYLPISSRTNIFYTTVDEINNDHYFKIQDDNDIKIYMKRLKMFNPITESIIKCFQQGIKNKITMYYRIVDEIVETLEDILKNKSYEFKNKSKKFKLSKEFNECINKYFVKNIQKLLNFLITDYYPHTTEKIGLSHYKGGKDLYRLIVKNYLYDFATPENIHDFGLQEVKRVFKEMNKIKEKHKDSIKEIKIYDDKLFKKLNTIRNKIYKNNTKYFHDNLKPNELYDIKPIRNRGNGTAYYYPSDFQMKKKGAFYINTRNHNFNEDELLTLSLHEGIPGHHYQLQLTMNDPNIPDYLKYFDSTAYVEGWGLYSENLYDYKNISEYYYKLKYELLRSTRLVIDTGIHFYGWSREDCLKYRNKYLPKTNTEYKRYIDTPGQALCYKIGESTIKFLRDKYLEKNNNIKDFHKTILEIGPIPLGLLINEMKKKYICKL